MVSPGTPSNAVYQRVCRVFRDLSDPHTPLSLDEVAGRADCPEADAREALDSLVRAGELASKRVAEDRRVWWSGTADGRKPADQEFQAFVDAVTDYAIFTLDPDGVVTTWNEGARRIKGYERSDIVGGHFSVFYTDRAVAAGDPAANLEAAASAGSVEDEGWRVRADGTTFRANVTLAAITDDDGTLQGFTKVTRDMTQQREYEKKLERERDLTRQVFETVPVSVFVTAADGTVIRANARASEEFGIQATDDGTFDIHDLALYDESGAPLAPSETPWGEVISNETTVKDVSVGIDRRDGTRGQYRVYAAPTFDSEGDLQRVITTGEDITALKRRESELERRAEELESELSEMFGRISDAFYALDRDWQFTHVNERAHEVINPEGQELIGENVWEAFPEAAERSFKPKFERAMFEQETVSFEEYYPDPLDAWFELRAYPSETGLSVYFRDITERKARERQLRASERRYRTLVQSFPNGLVALFDEDLKYTAVGGDLLDTLGIDREAALGNSVRDRYSESFAEDIVPHFEAALRGERGTFEVELDGHTLRADTIPITRGDDPTGMVVSQDITEQREYERRLEASNERLEQFAYAASHDLQEPLRMVSSYLTLIENRYGDELDSDGREFLAFAVDGADRMRDMIDGLLQYSRVDMRGDPFEPVDLNRVLDAVRADLTVRIEETGADIEADPLPTVEGDEDQLRQLFQNLLDNAIEYRRDEPPRIEVTVETEPDRWLFSVTDNGVGIDPDDTDRIFEVFQSLHSGGDHSGTGIGLALCRRIVERHDGQIWVAESAGPGSRFTFTLPKERAA